MAQPQVVDALPHDAHFMGIMLAEISALSTCHPEQNPGTQVLGRDLEGLDVPFPAFQNQGILGEAYDRRPFWTRSLVFGPTRNQQKEGKSPKGDREGHFHSPIIPPVGPTSNQIHEKRAKRNGR